MEEGSNLFDSSKVVGFTQVSVVTGYDYADIETPTDTGMQVFKYFLVFTRPVGQREVRQYPIRYRIPSKEGQEVRSNSKFAHFLSALDTLGVPTEGRPDNIIGRVWEWQDLEIDALKRLGEKAARVSLPVKKFESEAAALVYLGLEEGEMPIEERAEITAPATLALTPEEEKVAEIAIGKNLTQLKELAFSEKELEPFAADIWDGELLKKLEAAGKLKIVEREGEEYFLKP